MLGELKTLLSVPSMKCLNHKRPLFSLFENVCGFSSQKSKELVFVFFLIYLFFNFISPYGVPEKRLYQKFWESKQGKDKSHIPHSSTWSQDGIMLLLNFCFLESAIEENHSESFSESFRCLVFPLLVGIPY